MQARHPAVMMSYADTVVVAIAVATLTVVVTIKSHVSMVAIFDQFLAAAAEVVVH